MPETNNNALTVKVRMGNDVVTLTVSAGFSATLAMLREKLQNQRSTVERWRFELDGDEINLKDEGNVTLEMFKADLTSSRVLSIKMRQASEFQMTEVIVELPNEKKRLSIKGDLGTSLTIAREAIEKIVSKASKYLFVLDDVEIQRNDEDNYTLQRFEQGGKVLLKMEPARRVTKTNIRLKIDGESRRLTINADLDTTLSEVRNAIEAEVAESKNSAFIVGDEEIQRKDEANYTLRVFAKEDEVLITMRSARPAGAISLTIKLDKTSKHFDYGGKLSDTLNKLRNAILWANILPDKVNDFQFLTSDGDEIPQEDEKILKISEIVKDREIRIKESRDSEGRDEDNKSKPSGFVNPSEVKPKTLKKSLDDRTGDDAFAAADGDPNARIDVIFQKLPPEDQWWLVDYWGLNMGLNSRCEARSKVCAYRREALPEVSIPNPEAEFVSKFFFKNEELELVRSTSWSVGINAQGGYGPVKLALSADFRRSIEETEFTRKQSISIFASYSIRRLRLKFDVSDITPAPRLAKAIQQLIDDLNNPGSSRLSVFKRLENLFKDFGTHIATEVIVGASLWSRTEKEFQNSTAATEAKTTFQAALSGKVASIANVRAEGGFNLSDQQNQNIETQMKTMTLNAVGGEASMAGKPEDWLKTTRSHLGWRIIQFKDEGVCLLPEIFPPEAKKILYELARNFKFSDDLRIDSERYLEFWKQSVLYDQERAIGNLLRDVDLEHVVVKNNGEILADGLYGLLSKQEIILMAESKPKQLTEGAVYDIYADGDQFLATYRKFENGRLYFTVK